MPSKSQIPPAPLRIRRDRSSTATAKPHCNEILGAFPKISSGFTLLEILIAITMTALILGTLLGVFTGMMSSSANASKRPRSIRQEGRSWI